MENQNPITASITLKQLGMRACGTCVKAKAKCVPSTESRKCQRCHRLEKDCQPSSSNTRKRPKSAQVAQLEKKLDSIVTLLTGPIQRSGDHVPLEQAQHLEDSSSPSRSPKSLIFDPQLASPDDVSLPLEYPDTHPRQESSGLQLSHLPYPVNPSIFGFNLRIDEADFLLAEFRNNMAHHIPFVIIPPSIDSEDLRRERPVLWKAVMVAVLHSQPQRQESLGRKFMEDVSTRILLRAEKSLDLLQGILIHLCWYHYHAALNPQETNLIYLAKALVTNLGYNRTRIVKDRRRILMDGVEDVNSASQPNLASPGSEVLEQWRAVSGCFAITSMAVTSCRRIDAFRYTSHVKDLCKRLSETQQFQSDRLIIHLCQLQSISLKISDLFNESDDNASGPVPMKMYIGLLKNELQAIKNDIPADIQHNTLITSTCQVAEISLYEVGLYRTFYPETEKIYRLSALSACLVAVKSYFEEYFSTSSSFHPSDPYLKWVQASYALLMGFKLCLCTTDGWDRDHARQILDFPSHLEVLIQKLELVIQMRSHRNPESSAMNSPDIFSRFLRQVQRFKAWYDSILARKVMSEGGNATHSSYPTLESYKPGNQDLDMIMEGFNPDEVLMNIDDSFWEGLLSENVDWIDDWNSTGPVD